MKKYWVLLLATISFVMGSCTTSSNEEVVYDDRCFIWDVSLGSLKREVHLINIYGNDTTVTVSYTGANYPMTINQRALTIENKDSLLYGTQLQSVLLDITYTGSSLSYRIKDDVDSIWHSYSSSDSMDLRKPIELMLIANDGMSSRCYTLTMNVHKQEGDSLYWKKTDDAVPQLLGLNQQRAILIQDNLAVLGRNGDAIVLVERTAESVWNEAPTNLPVEADVQTLTKRTNTFFISTIGGDIYTATDGKNWQKLNTPQRPGLVLAGVTPHYLYVLMDGELYRCNENGQGEWDFLPEALDESSVYLPSKDVKTLLMSQANGNQRLVMVGNRSNETDKSSVVWNKAWNEDVLEGEAVWMFMNQTDDNKCTLPQLEYMNLMQYDGKCMAFGGASVAGKGTNKAMDALYVSQDYGISWHKDSELHLPVQLNGINGPISSVVDDNNVIWIIANGEVWRGKLNRLNFSRQ
ncbi:MAG: hypothetical protein J6W52_10920 [Bacteroidaceae bacterium]|nr:hypothetical protein [Bacteroidaceae bacterium]